MTREEEDAVLAQAKAIEKSRNDALHSLAESAERHVDRLWNSPGSTNPFTLDELRFAAAARCSGCKLGLAYPKNVGFRSSWSCSGILLKTVAQDRTAHDRLPFAFYEVKSEDQPSANGATTRPAP